MTQTTAEIEIGSTFLINKKRAGNKVRRLHVTQSEKAQQTGNIELPTVSFSGTLMKALNVEIKAFDDLKLYESV